jgi:hypothetical protein
VQGLRVPATVALSALAALLGIVLILETAIVGGSVGYLLGGLFLLAGVLRLVLVLRAR